MTDGRKYDSHTRGVKGIRDISQLTERCDGYEGGARRCKEVWEGVTVVRKCDRRFVSWLGGVMFMGRSKRARGSASLDRECDSH